MTTNDNDFLAKTSWKFHCEKCDYYAERKYNFNIHLNSIKHTNNISDNNNNAFLAKNSKHYECINCNKVFNDRAGLWRHKKKCITTEKIINEPSDKQLIMLLIKENSELRKEQSDIKELILEIVKNGTHNTTNNTTNNTNSHNKAFNLNFFLNETCKNAMNITDFVDSIKLQLTDLMDVGEVGYVEGISKIIMKNLNNLDETERPIHCTDKKRETMYIKDADKWEKEDEKKTKLKKAITKIADKNIRLLPQFREKYPDYGNSSSKTSDVYNKMVIEVMETDTDKAEKIIKNISKATIIKDK